jgi:hypothetical protein
MRSRKPDLELRFRKLQGEAESRLWDAFDCERAAAEAWRTNHVAVFVECARALAKEYREAASIYESMALECEAGLMH